MRIVKLSSVPNWKNLSSLEIINWLIDNNFDTIVNNFSSSQIEYDLQDLEYCWEDVKEIAILAEKLKDNS